MNGVGGKYGKIYHCEKSTDSQICPFKNKYNCAFRKTPQENFIERFLAKVSFLPEKSYLLLSDGSFMLLVVVRDTIKFNINNKCIFLLYGRKL